MLRGFLLPMVTKREMGQLMMFREFPEEFNSAVDAFPAAVE